MLTNNEATGVDFGFLDVGAVSPLSVVSVIILLLVVASKVSCHFLLYQLVGAYMSSCSYTLL